MLKLIFLCRRRPEITHDRYAELLLQGHVPIALRHHPTMRRYVVNLVDAAFGGAAPLDSIGQLWFDSLDDYRARLYDSPEGQKIVGRDVAGFLGGADAYATREYVHRETATRGRRLGERTGGVKLLVALRRVPSMDRESFAQHWLARHAPLVLRDPRVRRYTASVVEERLGADAPDYDGFAELQLGSEDDLAAHMAFSAPEHRGVREDIERFVSEAVAYRVSEFVERW